VSDDEVPTLYEWAGGSETFERLTATFYRKVHADEVVGPLFADMDPHPHYVAMWLSEVFGGPPGYSETRGGHPHMLGKHLGKGITEPQQAPVPRWGWGVAPPYQPKGSKS
jgi:hemoglobin